VVIAWRAAHDESMRPLAVANMTGANRLLVGVAWPLVWFLNAWRHKVPKIRTPRELGLEVFMLVVSALAVSAMATLGGNFTILDGCILAAIFLFYAFLAIRSGGEEAHGVGPAAALMALPKWQRRGSVVLLLALAAGAILVVAEPFAESLVQTGRAFGISEFVLIQWVAPLASEAPEVVVAILLVFERRSTEAIAVLVASKVNQFTLLVGCLPFAYGASSGRGEPLPLDHHQIAEVAVTGGQTLFAAATVANRTLGRKGGFFLFGLFVAQLAVSTLIEQQLAGDKARLDDWQTFARWVFAAVYTALAVTLLVVQRREVKLAFGVAMRRIRTAFTF
jgi:cation:H+ antiporter